MIIKDLNKVFKLLDGRNMTVNIVDDEKGSIGGQKVTTKDLTLREVVTNSLLAPPPDQQMGRPAEVIEGAEKARRYYLAIEIYKAKKQIELNVDNIKLIMDEIGRVYPPIIVGQAYEILDPPEGSSS